MLGHVDEDSIVWLVQPSKRQMRTKSGDVYATWYGDDGIQIVPINVELGDADALRYAQSARDALMRSKRII